MPRKRKYSLPHTIISSDRSKHFVIGRRSINFLVSNEQKTFHTPEVEKLTDEARALLHARNGQAAERLYRQALALEPGQSDLLNNLAASLLIQNRKTEGKAVLETIHLLFPDYLFARTGLASIAVREGDLERAADLLEPLFERRDLHYSEFDSICMSQIELLIMQNELVATKEWFKIWEDCNPKNPKLDSYRHLLQQDNAKSG